MPRPIRELKALEKIGLEPGQTKRVEFELEARDFSYYNQEFSRWTADTADFYIEIGSSSRDIRQRALVAVNGGEKPASVMRTDTGLTELFENPAAKAVFYQFLVENGLVEQEQVNDELDESLVWSFWGIQSFLDVNSGGIITYEKMNEVVERINKELFSKV